MLKTRLIPVLYIKNGLIVRSEGFAYHQNIGNVIDEAKRYDDWDVDELIYLDISREKTYDSKRDDHRTRSYLSIEEIIMEISKVCCMPLTFGGGIRTMADVDLRINTGADKIVLNTGAFENPDLIRQVSLKYGAQCVVMSIDYRAVASTPTVFTGFGRTDTAVSVFDWATECARLGAGEIFLNSIDRDGAATGYDIPTIAAVAAAVRLPVVACGGAGDFGDFVALAKQAKVSGIAAGNIFHFTELSYPRAKRLLREEGINVR